MSKFTLHSVRAALPNQKVLKGREAFQNTVFKFLGFY